MWTNPVREGARWVVGRARWVSLDGAAARALAGELLDLEVLPWPREYHFVGGEELTLRYLLVLDALNFCFWPGKGRWCVEGPDGRELDGYPALAYSLKRVAEGSPEFFEAGNLASLGEGDLREVLGEIPLLPERARAAQEVGRALAAWGSARSFLGAGSCRGIVARVLDWLPSFRDACLYGGRWVPFWKRAQILCADIHGAFGGEGPGDLPDLDWLTAFADYKLPQLLRSRGVILLHPALARRVDTMRSIPPGSDEEVEVRAATVRAVELLVGELARIGRPMRAFEVDWLLWNLSQAELPFPHHRTLTIFY